MTIADRVRDARLAWFAGHGIVAAFAVGEANRMDRREIEDVEAHLFGVIDPPKAIAKGRSTIGPTLSGAGEEFVPGGGASRDAVDDHMWWRGVPEWRPLAPRR